MPTPSFNILFFDCETTGLNKHPLTHERYQPEVIEFYGLIYNGRKVVAEYETMIRPTRIIDVPEKITKITGIDQSMLEGKPTFAEVADKIAKLIGRADQLCGHNVTFDVDVITTEFARLELPTPLWPPRSEWLCTVEQTMHLKGHRLSLEVLHEMLFGEKHKSAHRAKADVEAHVKVHAELIKRGMI